MIIAPFQKGFLLPLIGFIALTKKEENKQIFKKILFD
jgi:hypothetical protein